MVTVQSGVCEKNDHLERSSSKVHVPPAPPISMLTQTTDVFRTAKKTTIFAYESWRLNMFNIEIGGAGDWDV